MRQFKIKLITHEINSIEKPFSTIKQTGCANNRSVILIGIKLPEEPDCKIIAYA
jgi:hypothetical protein